MYSSEFFYHNESKSFSFSDVDLEKVSKLKSSIEQSGYYERMLVWKLEDNLDVVKDEEELSRLFVVMQFLSMTASPTKELMDKFDVKPWHMSLLRRLYLEFENYDDVAIMMGYKRPFGNSYVIGDVREEMIRYNYFSKLKGQYYNPAMFQDDVDDSPEEEAELNLFVDFLNEFYKGNFICHFNSFICQGYNGSRKNGESYLWESYPHMLNYRAHSNMRHWDIDKSHLRNEKIEKILD